MKLEGTCKMYTNLTPQDIEYIKKIVQLLPTIAEFVGADIFIDCPTREKDTAVVVAQAKAPFNSNYNRDIVGEFAGREREPAVLRTLETGMPSRKYKAITQEDAAVIQDVIPLKNEDGEVIGALIAEIDELSLGFGKKNILEEATLKLLKDFNNYKSDVINLLKEGIIVFDYTGVVVYYNQPAKKIYEEVGFEYELLGESFDNIVFNNFTFKNLIDNLSSNISIKKETNVSNKSLKIEYLIVKDHENYFNVYMVIRDITEEKHKEKQLMLKSVAIQEIHHRVKNNLQTIASLLRIQKRRVKDEETKEILEESINRVVSIALTHEILSQNGFDDIEIKTIIHLICKNLKQSYIDKSKKMEFNISGDSFSISSDKATSIALIVNEILQNAFDHAFEDIHEGKITIKIEKGPFYSKVSISDNGVGSDEISKGEGLGYSIIKTIVTEKLNGSLDFVSRKGKGTTISFDFKNN